MTDLFTGLPESQQPIAGDVEQIERDPVTVFLNRWAFNWRGERAVIEKELRELIAKAKVDDARRDRATGVNDV